MIEDNEEEDDDMYPEYGDTATGKAEDEETGEAEDEEIGEAEDEETSDEPPDDL
jgi:hypothetical protein